MVDFFAPRRSGAARPRQTTETLPQPVVTVLSNTPRSFVEVVSTLVLVVGLVLAGMVWRLSGASTAAARESRLRRTRRRPTRSDRRPASWYHLATYQDGRFAHLTPMRDGHHFEDEAGDCGCNPRAAAYRTREGRQGIFYVHRPHRDSNAYGRR